MHRIAWLAVAGFFAIAAVGRVRADEGMWQPRELPALAGRLAEAGLALEAERLASLDAYPMNAIVGLGFCTASFVSPQGLAATNHHCAYGALQFRSTGGRNLLRDGLRTARLEDEVPGDPALRMRVTESIRDVTAEFAALLARAGDGATAYDAVERRTKRLVRRCEADGLHHCEVQVFDGGAAFRLVRQLEIRDVRLVYAPPESIGKFGGDVDNWMWPRHTGDFAFLRAYVAPDGRPALPADDNVPYRPASWLKVDAGGVGPGDYVMLLGYPGRTSRWRLADELDEAADWTYPTVVREYRDLLGVIDAATRGRPEAQVRYAASLASGNNLIKNLEGQLAGFARAGAQAAKRAQQDAVLAWLAERGDGAALEAIAALRDSLADARRTRATRLYVGLLAPYNAEGSPRFHRDGSLLAAALDLYRWSVERRKPDALREPGYQARDGARLKARLEALGRRYDAATDRALMRHRLQRYAALPAGQRLPELDAWLGIEGDAPDLSGLEATLEAFYAGTRLADDARRMAWFEADARALERSEDSALRLAVRLLPALRRIEREVEAQLGREYRLRPAWLAALRAFHSDRGEATYADANGSLRVTFGEVVGYAPRDAVRYRAQTTLAGIAEKATGEPPFDAPAPLLGAIASARHAGYADARLGSVPVNFLSNLDVTGGNSGSPTLNARGELVGLGFDRNWESVASNWVFDAALTRAIHVDIRYMLWVMDEIDGAERLIREMGLEPASP